MLREEHGFHGYIHLKTIPDASADLLARAGRHADRLSIDVELPNARSLQQLAPEKDEGAIRRSMARLRLHIDEAREAAPRGPAARSLPGAAPRRAAAPSCTGCCGDLQHEPALRHDLPDAELMQARRMEKSVHRGLHKMRAFVRLREVALPAPQAWVCHIAWFEPEHRIVEANAPFFVRRFAQMRWAILSPERCIEWDGRQLHVRPGTDRSQAPAPDAGEPLWPTYYAHISDRRPAEG